MVMQCYNVCIVLLYPSDFSNSAAYQVCKTIWWQKHSPAILAVSSHYREAKKSKTPLSLGYHGNIVDLWWAQRIPKEPSAAVTSSAMRGIHCVLTFAVSFSFQSGRGWCRSTRGLGSCWRIWVQTRLPFTTRLTEATTQSSSASARPTSSWQLTLNDSKRWCRTGGFSHTPTHCFSSGAWIYWGEWHGFPAGRSLQRHVKAINKLADAGMFFWDYGNAFLLEAQRAGWQSDTAALIQYDYHNSIYIRLLKERFFFCNVLQAQR